MRRPISPLPALKKLKAFSLIEVLVAVCIMSLSLLGIGYCLFQSEHTLKGSYYQTQALTLASSVAESAIALSDFFQEKEIQQSMAKYQAAQKVKFASNPNSYTTYVSVPPRPPLVVFFEEEGEALQSDKQDVHLQEYADSRDVIKTFLNALHDYEPLIARTLPNGSLQLEPNGQHLVIKVLWHGHLAPQSVSLDVLLG